MSSNSLRCPINLPVLNRLLSFSATLTVYLSTDILISKNAPVKIKNHQGWSPLAEAISYGDRQTSEFSNLFELSFCAFLSRFPFGFFQALPLSSLFERSFSSSPFEHVRFESFKFCFEVLRLIRC